MALTALGAALATGFALAAVAIASIRGFRTVPFGNGLLDRPGERSGWSSPSCCCWCPCSGSSGSVRGSGPCTGTGGWPRCGWRGPARRRCGGSRHWSRGSPVCSARRSPPCVCVLFLRGERHRPPATRVVRDRAGRGGRAGAGRAGERTGAAPRGRLAAGPGTAGAPARGAWPGDAGPDGGPGSAVRGAAAGAGHVRRVRDRPGAGVRRGDRHRCGRPVADRRHRPVHGADAGGPYRRSGDADRGGDGCATTRGPPRAPMRRCCW